MKVVPRESILVVGLATAFCLLLGVVVGVAIGNAGRPTPIPLPTATLPVSFFTTPLQVTPGAQVSVLLLAVDSLSIRDPQLEGVWVVTFQAGQPQYFLLGFSPATQIQVAGDANARTLQDAYATDRRLGLGTKFTRDALKSISPGLISPQYEVMFDRSMLRWTVNTLNGVTVREEWLTGEKLSERYDEIPPDNPLDRLVFQGEALHAILTTVQSKEWSSDAWRPYFNLGQKWTLDAESFNNLMETVLPTVPQAEFYINLAPLAPEVTPTP